MQTKKGREKKHVRNSSAPIFFNKMGSHTSKKHRLNVPKYDLNHFGVITVLFNPIKYKSRYELYHKFDEHMTRSGVTLLTVECIFESSEEFGLPKQKFELTRANDPRHLQIKAPISYMVKRKFNKYCC